MTPDLPTARAYCEAAFHSGAEGVLIQDKSMLRVVLDAVRAEANADAEHDLDALLIEARYWALCYQPGTEQKRRFTRVVDALQSLRAENAAHKARITDLEVVADFWKARAEAAEADNARLREALEKIAKCWDVYGGRHHVFSAADCQRIARSALNQPEDGR